jgi:hypothetical protein
MSDFFRVVPYILSESLGEPIKLYTNNFDRSSPRIQLYPNNGTKKCLECTSSLKSFYSSTPRNIKTLEGEKKVTEHIWICTNELCPNFNVNVYPIRLTPLGSCYGLDIIAEVGRLRRDEKKTYKEIIQC